MFSIETTKNDPEFLNYVEEGKTIYDGATKKELGKIVAIHEKPAREIAENHESKTIEYVEIPNKVDVILEVEGKATMEYPNIIIDTVSIKVGKRIDCIVGDAAVNGTVISLDYDKALLKKEGGAKQMIMDKEGKLFWKSEHCGHFCHFGYYYRHCGSFCHKGKIRQ